MCGNWQHFTITMNTWKSILPGNQFCLSISRDLCRGFKWTDWLWRAVNFIFWVVLLTLWWHVDLECPFDVYILIICFSLRPWLCSSVSSDISCNSPNLIYISIVRFHLSIFRTHNNHTRHLVRHSNSISLYSIAPQLQQWLFLNRTAIQPSQHVLTIIFEILRPNKTRYFFYISRPIHLIDRCMGPFIASSVASLLW